MRDAEETIRRLAAVKELGVRIAIDDFGTGYSSLSHLQQFPVDALKIDRSFISRLSQNPEGETLIRTLVQLGKAMSIETLAEGIERPHELDLLKDEQCDSGQASCSRARSTRSPPRPSSAPGRESSPNRSRSRCPERKLAHDAGAMTG